jgi:hypothetical protein
MLSDDDAVNGYPSLAEAQYLRGYGSAVELN